MHRILAAVASVAVASALAASALGALPIIGEPVPHLAPSPAVSVTTLPQLPAMSTPAPAVAPAYTQAPAAAGGVVAPPGTVIQIVGDVAYPKVVTLKDLQLMQHVSLTMRVVDPDGKRRLHIYTGVLLHDLIAQTAPTAAGGATNATNAFALVVGVNGDSAIVAFPEFETAFNNKRIIIAYEVDGAPLPGQNIGMLIVPEDQSSGRFIVGVSTIRISSPSP